MKLGPSLTARAGRMAHVNPIIVKELRSRMRGARAFVILTAMLLLLGLASYALFSLVALTRSYGGSPLSPLVGQAVFSGLAILELLAICFITPALTTGAISGEREMQTYEMLLTTPLNPASILRGKLISALSYVFLLVFAAIPMVSLVFTFGGVSPGDMIKVLVILAAVAVSLGTLGIFMSAWLRRTGRATVLTYLVVLVLFVGTTMAYGLTGALRQQVPPRWLLIANPASALFSAITPVAGGAELAGILSGLTMILGGNLGLVVQQSTTGAMGGIPRPLYHYTLALYGGVSLVLYLLATRLVKPVRRWRLTRREIAGGVALLLLFAAAVGVPFGLSFNRYERASLSGNPTPTPAPFGKWGVGIAERAVAVAVAPPVPMLEPTIAPPPTPTPLPASGSASSPLPTPTPQPPPELGNAPATPDPALPATDVPSTTFSLPEKDQAAVYAAVVRQVYTVDHTFGDRPPNFPVVYLVSTTEDSAGDPNLPRLEPRLLPETVQEAIAAALADLPAEFRWVGSRDEVPLEQPGDRVSQGGAIFTLGNIHPQPDGTMLVSASLYFANLGAGGKTYVLQNIDGEWVITGTTGVEWIS